EDPEIYVHRIGRTARAGRGGIAWMFVTPEQGQLLTQIEALTNVEIQIKEYPDFKPGPIPEKVSNQQKEEENRIAITREEKNPTKLDLPDKQKSKDESSFPGGIVPKQLPNKRLGGRVRTRKR
ncbi:MAG: hypothetical protein QGF07_04050, partial [Phycisphaerales bacterium]|nr:hypothetical protein [Phycisphaerales bacterium]